MIKVGDINKTSNLSGSKSAPKVTGSGFSAYLSQSMGAENRAVSGTHSVSIMDAIFATQMVGGEEERELKRKLLKRGNNLVDKLEEIRTGILIGGIPKDKLIEISRFVKDRRFNAEDSKLQSLMEEIELRVEVELAKLMR